jgi:uncharacterized small protein (DUF1192 family)
MTDLATEAEQLREIQRLNAHINNLDAEIERLHRLYDRSTDQAVRFAAEVVWFRAALESIAKNTCCDRCQEAALVARHALEPEP